MPINFVVNQIVSLAKKKRGIYYYIRMFYSIYRSTVSSSLLGFSSPFTSRF